MPPEWSPAWPTAARHKVWLGGAQPLPVPVAQPRPATSSTHRAHRAGDGTTHLPEVTDIEEVEGVEQLAVPQAKLIVADFEEGTDVLQTQELERGKEEAVNALVGLGRLGHRQRAQRAAETWP